MDINLDQMSVKELRDLRGKVDRAISSFEDRRKREALAAAETAVRQFGFNLSDLNMTKGPRAKAAAKYVHPENSEQTWSGRGRRPRWVQEALDSGKSLSDLEI